MSSRIQTNNGQPGQKISNLKVQNWGELAEEVFNEDGILSFLGDDNLELQDTKRLKKHTAEKLARDFPEINLRIDRALEQGLLPPEADQNRATHPILTMSFIRQIDNFEAQIATGRLKEEDISWDDNSPLETFHRKQLSASLLLTLADFYSDTPGEPIYVRKELPSIRPVDEELIHRAWKNYCISTTDLYNAFDGGTLYCQSVREFLRADIFSGEVHNITS